MALLHKEKPSRTPYTTVESLFNKAQVHRVSGCVEMLWRSIVEVGAETRFSRGIPHPGPQG